MTPRQPLAPLAPLAPLTLLAPLAPLTLLALLTACPSATDPTDLASADAGTQARDATVAAPDATLPSLDAALDDGSTDASIEVAPDATSPDAAPDAAMADALPRGIFPIATLDPVSPIDDLAPLDALVAGADVIGLGESVHTSGGFYAAKDRLIRYAVEHLGVRALAMETPRTAAELTARYVERCEGSSRDALRGIFGVFADTNTLALVEWLCAYNTAHPDDPVRFYGFDEQQPDDDSAILAAFTRDAAPGDDPTLTSTRASCLSRWADSYDPNGNLRPYPEAAHASCLAGLDAIAAYLTANEAALVAATSRARFDAAVMAVVSLRAWQEEIFYYGTDVARSYEARDVAMAWIFEHLFAGAYAGKRTVLWAHDYHLTANHPNMTFDYPPSTRTLGTELRAHLGDRYQPVAITAFEAEINWPGIGTGPTQARFSPHALEPALHALGQPLLLLDARATWLTDQAIDSLGWSPMVVAEQFRAVLFLDRSPGMDAIFW